MNYRSFIPTALIFFIGLFAIIYTLNNSLPGEPFYSIRQEAREIQISIMRSDEDKANSRLEILTTDVDSFDRLSHKDPKNKQLIALANDVIHQASEVTTNLDNMKNQGKDVKEEAEKLCEALEHQVLILKFLGSLTSPEINAKLTGIKKITDKYVDQAMEWE